MQIKPLKTQDPVKIDHIMKEGRLGSLMSKLEAIKKLNDTLYDYLPSRLRPYCQVLNIDFNTVIIGAASSQVANSLFYSQNDILRAFQLTETVSNVSAVRVKVSAQLF